MEMTKYPKMQTIFMRGEKKKIIEGDWTLPEYEYLQNNIWIWTEKLDGTNTRIGWDFGNNTVTFDGRTENAQIPARLVNYLFQNFPRDKFAPLYDFNIGLYGEGIGAGIQGKWGKAYAEGFLGDPKANGFVLFDVKVLGQDGHPYWLTRDNVEDVGKKLGIPVVPIIGEGTLHEAIQLCKDGFMSQLGNVLAEGIVMKPKVELCKRGGGRLITKLKHRDFANV